MTTPAFFLAALPGPKPIALGVAALVVLYLAFRSAKFLIKVLLLLVALAVVGLAVWWHFAPSHGAL